MQGNTAMTYDYITDNNLYDKQNYMYSKYCGVDFLEAYAESRKMKASSDVSREFSNDKEFQSETYCQLGQIYEDLSNGADKSALSRLNGFVKSFEVRKRLYDRYHDWKPSEGASFENYENYLIFSDCLLEAYAATGNLKYFSCVLKVDDTLLSLQDKLSSAQAARLRTIIDRELRYFRELLEEHGICMEA
jgi:hypothetical protein